MKLNKKIIFVIFIMGLLFNSAFVFADSESAVKNMTESAVNNLFQDTIGKVLGGITGALTGVISGVTGEPIITGVIGAAASTFITVKGLDKKWDYELDADRVNISDREQEFIDDRSFSKLKIDPNKEMIITDQNVLDVEYNETIKNLTLYKDDTKNPSLRVSEKTEVIAVLDSNNTKVDGQRRGLLFEDPNLTIKNAYEYRTLVIKYNEATYTKQPLKVTLKNGFEIFGESWYQLYSSGASAAKKLIEKKVLKFDVDTKNEIPKERIQKFHLLFNSRVDDEVTIDKSLFDCVSEDGRIIGKTGKDELPLITLNWDFLEKTRNNPLAISGEPLSRDTWCDIEADGVYCDATQFSIEVLQKIKQINDYVEQYHSCFTCPVNYQEQEIISEKNNVGILFLSGELNDDLSSVTINYKIKGNYEIDPQTLASRPLFKINYNIEKKSPNTFNWVTISSGTLKNIDASYLNDGSLTEEEKIIKLQTKPTEEDIIKITITLEDFNPVLENYETGNNILDNSLKLETSLGLEACNIEKTSTNLLKYSQSCSKKFDEKLINFKAYLMNDGYSYDFRKDFDDHYRFTLFQTPNWYSEIKSSYAPLYKYFIDKDKFKFRSNFSDSISESGIPGPGRYNIEIEINYDDRWNLFNDAGEITGNINVIINHDQKPVRDSPLYYMPINGVVGNTGEKTRNGYGVSYIGDVVSIDHVFNQGKGLETEGFVSQNTISTIDTKEISDFSIMSTGDTRGKLLEIQKLPNKISLKYIPSRATSVVMSVTNKSVNTDAFAYYKLSIGLPENEGGAIANPGRSLTTWSGFAQCKDFTGVPLLERFLGTNDLVSVESQLAPITQSQGFTYGVEWPKNIITRTGTVWLYTIFYTPSNFRSGNGISYLYRDSANDSLKFYVNDLGTSETTSVPLYNTLGSDKDIKSIKAIFDLVKDKKACINFDSSTLDVFYNPKEISKPLTDMIDSKLEANKENPNSEFSCIRQ